MSKKDCCNEICASNKGENPVLEMKRLIA